MPAQATWEDFTMYMHRKWGAHYAKEPVDIMFCEGDIKLTWTAFLAGDFMARTVQVEDEETWRREVLMEAQRLFALRKEVSLMVRFG